MDLMPLCCTPYTLLLWGEEINTSNIAKTPIYIIAIFLLL